jgi:crotonobetainyl-CoA:carnitine CoA-transferase CaiB-like acyl-CoA transferase
MVAAYSPKRWAALCRVLGQPDLATDERFDTNEKRVDARSELAAVLEPLFRTRITADWIEALDAADVLCGPLMTYPELIEQDHIVESDSLLTVEHPAVGEVCAPAFPGRLSGTSCRASGPPPPIPGEHSDAILRECGFHEGEIRALRCDGTVMTGATDDR